MSLRYASFYFGTLITESAFILDLEESSVTYSVVVPYGSYAPKTFRAVLEANILAQTGLVCRVDFDYLNRIYRLTFEDTVTILGATGANVDVSVLPALGLPATDTTGTVFTGTSVACSKFEPNFPLVSFLDKENSLDLFGLTQSETASQLREVVHFGERNYYRFGIRYITNLVQPSDSYIKTNPLALSQARAWMKQVLSGQGIDFFKVRSTVLSGYSTRPDDTIQLDISSQSQTTIELSEMVQDGIQGFYEFPAYRFNVKNFEPLSDVTPEELARLLQEMGDLILQESGGGILV